MSNTTFKIFASLLAFVLSAGACAGTTFTYKKNISGLGTWNGASDNGGGFGYGNYGGALEASIVGGTLNFGSSLIGDEGGASVELINSGDTPLAIQSIGSSGDFFTESSCGAVLEGGATCFVTVYFRPVSMGVRTGTLSVSATDGSFSVPLTGVGLSALASSTSGSPVVLSPTQIGQSVSQSLFVMNNSNSPLTIQSISVSNGFTYTAECESGTELAWGDTCNITITTTPVYAGPINGTLTLQSTGGPLSIPLSGEGTTGLPLYSSAGVDGFISFGDTLLGTTSSNTITLMNPGTASIDLHAITVTGVDFSYNTTCGGSLAGGQTCDINLGLTPYSTGDARGGLAIQSSSGNYSYVLSGKGIPWIFIDDGAPIHLLHVRVGDIATKHVAVQNLKDSPVTIQSISISGASFGISSTCPVGGALASRAYCWLTITSQPTVAGPLAGRISIHTVGAGPSELDVDGTAYIPIN